MQKIIHISNFEKPRYNLTRVLAEEEKGFKTQALEKTKSDSQCNSAHALLKW